MKKMPVSVGSWTGNNVGKNSVVDTKDNGKFKYNMWDMVDRNTTGNPMAICGTFPT